MIYDTSVITATKDQMSCDLSDESVILNLRSGIYFGLDPVGSRIWSILQQPVSFGELRETILREYEIEPERCDRELLSFLQELESQGLIEADSAHAG